MSLIRLVTVNCDAEPHAPGCPWWIAHELTAAEARAHARAAGWTRTGTGRDARDFSPQCWRARV